MARQTFQAFLTDEVERIAEQHGATLIEEPEYANTGTWILRRADRTLLLVSYSFQQEYSTFHPLPSIWFDRLDATLIAFRSALAQRLGA